MLSHIWSLLCNKSLIDTDTNNISIIDVFERVDVNAKIALKNKQTLRVNIPVHFELVSFWFREKNNQVIKADVKVDFLNPTKEKIKTFSYKIEIPNNLKRLRSRLKINGLTLYTSGDYFFKIKVKEEGQKNYRIVAEIPLEVNLQLEDIREESNKKRSN